MEDRSLPRASSSSDATVRGRRLRIIRHTAACTGRSCGSCAAGVIADCVALCCCPCGVVSILALAFLKLPWAMARRCLAGRRRGRRRRGMLEEASGGAGEIGAGGAINGGFGRVSFTGVHGMGN